VRSQGRHFTLIGLAWNPAVAAARMGEIGYAGFSLDVIYLKIAAEMHL
jgi:hypothetical protein